ncbi:PEGA domain-containing protein [bacterium]|nr:PEGA domain-containing protein [bacterium]
MRKIIIISLVLGPILMLLGLSSTECDAWPRPPRPPVFVPWFPFWAGPHVVILNGKYGYLDLDVVPEEAKVFINNEYIGICDQFDGFPDFLYLEVGTYTIRFSLESYLDHEQQITVRPGRELEFNTRLIKGPSSDYDRTHHPDQTQPASDDQEQPVLIEGPPAEPDRPETATVPDKPPSPIQPDQTATQETKPQPDGTGFIRFRIFPREATVYLDGTFVGVAHELNDRADALEFSAGRHQLEIMMPGHETASQELELKPGETSQVRIILIKTS